MSFPGAPNGQADPKPQKPFLPERPTPQVVISADPKGGSASSVRSKTVLLVFNVSFDIWLGALRALCWLLCSDE